ncbi:MAG: hypothetical protein NC543_02290 [bacterium]|nr:hypothetical protein [bacterium]MCM1374191.1 hypothetical protein [Muribaculum sp.]
MRSKFIQYYVEGEDEEKFIRILKSDLGLIQPGKVQKLNVIDHDLSGARLMTLRPGTMIVLIFDTDTEQVNILNRNLEKLKMCPAVSEIVTIPQIFNLEDELIHSCDIKKITELLGSKSKKEFKANLIRTNNLANKLREHRFDINLLWCRQPFPPYQNIKNQAEKIKLSGR